MSQNFALHMTESVNLSVCRPLNISSTVLKTLEPLIGFQRNLIYIVVNDKIIMLIFIINI